MTCPVLLSWDSAHFGFPVGKAEWDGTAHQLETLLHAARGMDFTLLYMFAPMDTVLPDSVVDACVSIYSSTRVEFIKDVVPSETLENSGESVNVIVLTPNNVDMERVRELSLIAGRFSRFLNDPMIPREKGEGVFRMWGEESVRGNLADAALGAMDSANVLLGLVTTKKSSGTGRIGLIAVDPTAQGEGLGTLLLSAVERWCFLRGLKELRVATQGENLAACRFYTRYGFTLLVRHQIYHVWLRHPACDYRR